MSGRTRLVAGCLLGVAVSLLLVGVVSGTLLRHVLQILPLVVVLVALLRGAAWAPGAALALFLFWLALMVIIWLFLLGVTRVISGTFTPAEVALTVVIGVCCSGGSAAVLVPPLGSGRLRGAVAFLGAAAVQVAILRLSMLRPFAHD
jgi:hypothetical protein